MTYPVIYDVTYSYSTFQQSQGNNAFPGTQVDADFAGLADSLASISTFMQGVMRSDGALQNGIVTYDSLSATLKSNGLAGANAWLTATSYLVGTPVYQGYSLYRCLVAHTSGVFATDLAAGDWLLLTALPQGHAATIAVGSVTTLAAGASATVVNAGTTEAATFNFGIPQGVQGTTGSAGPTGSTGAGYGGTSATSFLIGTGSKAFTTQAGLAYVVGSRVRAASNASGVNYMEGLVTAYAGTTLTVNVTRVGGSGTFADWNFSLAGDPGDLLSANNLSDVASAPAALNNLSGVSYGAAQTLTTTQRGQAAANMQFIAPPQGRLTLATGTPVMTTTQSAKTTLFYTPYVGNQLPIYDGTNMVPSAFSELSVATTDTTKSPAAIGASKVNDWFIWNDAGTIRLSHGPDWTSDTTRSAGTALVMVKGVLLNSVAITNGPGASRGTYVGTTRSNGSSQLDFTLGSAASGGGAAFFGLWNMYNRANVTTSVTDSGASYTYTSSTIRQARGSAGNQISFVTGVAEEAFSADVVIFGFIVAVAGAFIHFGVGLNSTTTFASAYSSLSNNSGASTFFQSLPNHCSLMPQLGLNVLSSNQSGDATNANSFNAGSTDVLTCLVRM